MLEGKRRRFKAGFSLKALVALGPPHLGQLFLADGKVPPQCLDLARQPFRPLLDQLPLACALRCVSVCAIRPANSPRIGSSSGNVNPLRFAGSAALLASAFFSGTKGSLLALSAVGLGYQLEPAQAQRIVR